MIGADDDAIVQRALVELDRIGIKTGSVLRLRSGGPPMTASNFRLCEARPSGGIEAHCLWFDGAAFQKAWILVHVLDVITAPSPPAPPSR